MICPTCLFKHASVGIPCGSCGGTMHGSVVIAQSATPIVPDLPVIQQQLSAAIVGFAPEPERIVEVIPVLAPVPELIAATEAPAPVAAEDPKQQPAKGKKKTAPTVQ